MTARVVRRIAIVVGALLVAGCQQAATAGLSDTDKAALKDKAQAVMKTINGRDFAGWAKDFTDDAEWLPPNAPMVKSRAAIEKYVAAGPTMSALTLTQVDVQGQGNLAYVRGDYTLNIAVPGAPAPVSDKGKYLEIWRKQADGTWKSSTVIFNSDNPVPAPAPAAAPMKKK